MNVFHLNIPWIIDQSEYNCSARSLSEWESRGAVNTVKGIYLIVSGSIFMTLYLLCLIGMLRGKLLKIACYRLMFFNGIIDNMDIISGSFIAAYFDLTGAVFCSSITLNWYAGYFSWCVWFGALFNCMVLALNRIVEMTPSARSLGFLFRGKFLLSWMVLSILLMTILPFISRTHPYSSQISTYIISPEITDNPTQLFTQALFICTTTAITALLYSWIEFFPAPRAMAVASHILWQLSHGLHGIVYLCLNRQIRGESMDRRRM
ncbi:hypothetical protein V3C99_006722 [Haemonchus contortus]